ncbi:hypothetical protein EYF80_008843 [Liparis tanakae]|uniref:Uncharacterized protein n=1 Tax=Liparis tanakae TaxID=230148 RepID=A0A4Z2ITB6_9TELE|nr:hypothetical protein EYF80_008843 [Liparis tanakae]
MSWKSHPKPSKLQIHNKILREGLNLAIAITAAETSSLHLPSCPDVVPSHGGPSVGRLAGQIGVLGPWLGTDPPVLILHHRRPPQPHNEASALALTWPPKAAFLARGPDGGGGEGEESLSSHTDGDKGRKGREQNGEGQKQKGGEEKREKTREVEELLQRWREGETNARRISFCLVLSVPPSTRLPSDRPSGEELLTEVEINHPSGGAAHDLDSSSEDVFPHAAAHNDGVLQGHMSRGSKHLLLERDLVSAAARQHGGAAADWKRDAGPGGRLCSVAFGFLYSRVLCMREEKEGEKNDVHLVL